MFLFCSVDLSVAQDDLPQEVSPTIQGGSIYVPFTVPSGAIYNASPNISVHYGNFIGNTADGQNPNCSHWPQYGYCPLHIRDFASTVPADASNNYWSQLDSKATWGSVTTAPVLSAPVSYGELSGEGDVCFVPPAPTPQECFAQPIPAEGVLVRDTRHGPWEFESPNANVKIGIPNDATVVVAYKAIDDATLWYYATSYILNGQEIPIEDSDGLEGDVHGNWILQRNILRLRKDEDMTQPYQGLLLDDSEACRSLPWYGEAPDCYGGTLNMDDTCSFTYNRDMAAAYAIVYAASPNPDATPDASPGDETSTLFCTYNYGGVHTGCASPNRPIPPATPEPNMTHPTDCANFTSIAMWYGGLPMTDRWFCEGIPCPIAGTSENYSWTNAAPSGQPTYLKSVLPGYATEGTVVFEPFKPLNADGTISYLDPDYVRLDVMEKIRAIWSSPDVRNIAKGDIVWAGKENVEHMMMVAGWGPMLVTWEEIDAFWDANKNPDGSYNYTVLTTGYPEPNHYFGYNPHPEFGYVPYLVDHGLHGAAEEGPGGIPRLICPECVKPRPYYALYWIRKNDRGFPLVVNLDQRDNAPQFIHIPDSLSVPVEEVKASPEQFDPDRTIPPIPAQ